MKYEEFKNNLNENTTLLEYLTSVPGGMAIMMDLLYEDERQPGEKLICESLHPGLVEEYYEISKALKELKK